MADHEALVERAAEALCAADQISTSRTWPILRDEARDNYRKQARAVVAAVSDALKAEGLREAADDYMAEWVRRGPERAVVTREWLRARADRLDPREGA
ncbi:hypothetical protein [Nocardioides montaniterrae]